MQLLSVSKNYEGDSVIPVDSITGVTITNDSTRLVEIKSGGETYYLSINTEWFNKKISPERMESLLFTRLLYALRQTPEDCLIIPYPYKNREVGLPYTHCLINPSDFIPLDYDEKELSIPMAVYDVKDIEGGMILKTIIKF